MTVFKNLEMKINVKYQFYYYYFFKYQTSKKYSKSILVQFVGEMFKPQC